MDKEMMKALEADGEKLRQMTGEEHGPFCPRCLVNPLGPKPIFLDTKTEEHICGNCWEQDRAADEVPQQWFDCEACGGEGITRHTITVYEPGCGFPHDDVEEVPCKDCHGTGGGLGDAEANQKQPEPRHEGEDLCPPQEP